MKHWKDLAPHQVGRVGRSLVADELNRRGALATLTNTTRTRVAVVAMHPDTSRTVNILVKTKRVKVWQWNIDKAEAAQQAAEDDFLILVDLQPSEPAYYIVRLRDAAKRKVEVHNAWLKSIGGRRPNTPDSKHTAIPVEDVEAGKDAWHILGVIPDAGEARK
ncbi:MAG: hypothetical protein OXC18_07580 [Desulfurellaceae bacterium]|nr:hypothetical protein [Desulfurellaceae bacterium]